MESANTFKKDVDYYIQTNKNYKKVGEKVNETCAIIERLLAQSWGKDNDNNKKTVV